MISSSEITSFYSTYRQLSREFTQCLRVELEIEHHRHIRLGITHQECLQHGANAKLGVAIVEDIVACHPVAWLRFLWQMAMHIGEEATTGSDRDQRGSWVKILR